MQTFFLTNGRIVMFCNGNIFQCEWNTSAHERKHIGLSSDIDVSFNCFIQKLVKLHCFSFDSLVQKYNLHKLRHISVFSAMADQHICSIYISCFWLYKYCFKTLCWMLRETRSHAPRRLDMGRLPTCYLVEPTTEATVVVTHMWLWIIPVSTNELFPLAGET